MIATEGASRSGVRCHWLGRIGFDEALERQQEHIEAYERHGDSVLFLEHEPVYTTGRLGKAENLPTRGSEVPVKRIGRGGDVTYHGPGQLVGYVHVDLRARGRDVHAFLRSLEAGVIALLRKLGVEGVRSEGRTGVWVPAEAGSPPRKIASIGIGVRRGISMHGFALNVSVDLDAFGAIVPCDLTGVTMTSVANETGRAAPSVAEVAELAVGPIVDSLPPRTAPEVHT